MNARLIPVASLLLVFIVLAGCDVADDSASDASAAQAAAADVSTQPARAVEGLEVTNGSIVQRIESSGLIRGASEATVISEVQGLIQEVSFDLGERVEEGDVLAVVESTIARLNLEEARQVYESARLDLSAIQRRFDAGSASQAELTRARSTSNGALARLEAAQKSYDDHTIRAPISGSIASRPADISRGNYLNRGVPIARVVDLSRIRLEIAVGERELEYLAVGAPVDVTVPACNLGGIAATIDSIAAGADQRTGSFPVIITWGNDCSTVRSGMSATATITALAAADQIIVPASAIRSDSEGSWVYVATDGVAQRRAITPGRRLGDRVEVVQGLEEGEVIVTSALSTVIDGESVTVSLRGTTGGER